MFVAERGVQTAFKGGMEMHGLSVQRIMRKNWPQVNSFRENKYHLRCSDVTLSIFINEQSVEFSKHKEDVDKHFETRIFCEYNQIKKCHNQKKYHCLQTFTHFISGVPIYIEHEHNSRKNSIRTV